MDKRTAARALLAIDGAGCLATAGALAADRRVGDLVHPGTGWRIPAIVALSGTGALLLGGASRRAPRNPDLRISALVNGGWVLACGAALARPLPRSGVALVALTAVLDGAVGAAQWALQD